MKHSSTRIVRIEEHQEQATLSAAQKSFNRLIKKIDKQRAQLAAWQAAMEFQTTEGDQPPIAVPNLLEVTHNGGKEINFS